MTMVCSGGVEKNQEQRTTLFALRIEYIRAKSREGVRKMITYHYDFLV